MCINGITYHKSSPVIDSIGTINGTINDPGNGLTFETSARLSGKNSIRVNATQNSFIDFGNQLGKFDTGNFTVAFWFKTAGISGQSGFLNLLGNLVSENTDGTFFNVRVTGDFEWGKGYMNVHLNKTGSQYVTFNNKEVGGRDMFNLADNAWHHIVIIRSAPTTYELYVDGVKMESHTAFTNITFNSTNSFKLGRHIASDKTPYNIAFDDLFICRRALSSDEIKRYLM
jgi:hypothetical protein